MGITLSIIVPVYNVEKHLKKCFDSILNQTFRDFELIIVNDGATDNSRMICLEYSKKDPRIIYLEKTNGGPGSARNYGLNHAKGNYIGFIDSDDWVDVNMYEVLVNGIRSTDADIVTCGHKVINLDGSVDEVSTISKSILYTGSMATKLILQDEYIFSFPWDKLYKKELFTNLRYPEGRIFEDTAFTYKLFAKTKKVYQITNCLYNYLRRDDSLCLDPDFNKIIERKYDNYLGFQERYEFVCTNKEYMSIIDICQSKAFIHGQQQLHFIIKNQVHNEKVSFNLIFYKLRLMNINNNNYLSLSQKIEHKIMMMPIQFYKCFLDLFYMFNSLR